MQLRSGSDSTSAKVSVEFSHEALFLLSLLIVFVYMILRRYIMKDTSVVIYATPRHKGYSAAENMDSDLIHIRIQFSPAVSAQDHKCLIRRTRAPSALDLGASASASASAGASASCAGSCDAEELKKEV